MQIKIDLFKNNQILDFVAEVEVEAEIENKREVRRSKNRKTQRVSNQSRASGILLNPRIMSLASRSI